MHSAASICFGVAVESTTSEIFWMAPGQPQASNPAIEVGMVPMDSATIFSWADCLNFVARDILRLNVEVCGAARIYRTASVWTAGLEGMQFRTVSENL